MSDKQSTDGLSCDKASAYRELTWLSKGTPNAGLERVKVSVLPSTKAILDPNNSLDILRRSLREIIKPKIALAGLKGIKP